MLELCRTGASSRANALNVAKWQSGEMAEFYKKIVSQNGTQFKKLFVSLPQEIKDMKIMVVVTGRDFRANTAKYVGVALRGEDVVVKSRAGSFRVVPISEDDIVINKRDLTEELRGALLEAKESIEGKRKLNTLDNLINELRVYVKTTLE